MSRACFFIVADKNTEYAVRGFLERDAFHLSLGCGEFAFDARQDLLVATGANDPGLYRRAADYARPPLATHRHLVIVLDADWQGSPGQIEIRAHMTNACVRSGWQADAVCVAVIDPEVPPWSRIGYGKTIRLSSKCSGTRVHQRCGRVSRAGRHGQLIGQSRRARKMSSRRFSEPIEFRDPPISIARSRHE